MELSDSSKQLTGQEPARLCQRIHAEFEEMPGLEAHTRAGGAAVQYRSGAV